MAQTTHGQSWPGAVLRPANLVQPQCLYSQYKNYRVGFWMIVVLQPGFLSLGKKDLDQSQKKWGVCQFS